MSIDPITSAAKVAPLLATPTALPAKKNDGDADDKVGGAIKSSPAAHTGALVDKDA